MSVACAWQEGKSTARAVARVRQDTATAWQRHGNRMATAMVWEWLGVCGAAGRQWRGSCAATGAWQLRGNRQCLDAWQRHGNRMATAWQWRVW